MTHDHRPDFFPFQGHQEGGFFNQGGSHNPFADLFRPPQAFLPQQGHHAHHQHDAGGQTHHHQYGAGGQTHHHQYDAGGQSHHHQYDAGGHAQHHRYDAAAHPQHNPFEGFGWPPHQHSGAGTEGSRPHHHHLPDLSITGDTGHHHKTKTQHPPRESAEPTERRSDTGMGSWGPKSSSSQAIADAARDAVGHQTYLPRPGSQYYGQHLSAGLGCTSASTNMFFDGLKAAGKVSDKDYHKLHQIGNDAAYVNMQHLGVAKPVNGQDLKPGDWAYFKNPGAKHGHSGVVFEGKNGELMLANNHGGRTVATPLSRFMHSYRSVRGLRANI